MLDENYHVVNCMDSCCLQGCQHFLVIQQERVEVLGWQEWGRFFASVPSLSSSFVAVRYLNSFTSRIFFNGTKSTRGDAVVWEISMQQTKQTINLNPIWEISTKWTAVTKWGGLEKLQREINLLNALWVTLNHTKKFFQTLPMHIQTCEVEGSWWTQASDWGLEHTHCIEISSIEFWLTKRIRLSTLQSISLPHCRQHNIASSGVLN
jgi:hypothetical protein